MSRKQHPQDDLNELCEALGAEIGYAYARLNNYSFDADDDRRMIELQWIESLTDLLMIYGDEDRTAYAAWKDKPSSEPPR
jgi:hypothetical protein